MLNPLFLPEIVGLVLDNVHMIPDLLNCACVNSVWNRAALKKLYRGSLNDMQFRTPDIASLNCLFAASRERFARNMTMVKHLVLSPESPAIDEAAKPNTRLACFEKLSMMRQRQYAKLLLCPQGRELASLAIPFEIINQDWSLISDLLLTSTVEYMAIDDSYCQVLLESFTCSATLVDPLDKLSNLRALTIYKSATYNDINGLFQLLDLCDLQFFHLESQHNISDLTHSEDSENPPELLSYLERQENLKALALNIPNGGFSLNSGSATPGMEGQDISWPRLKALYLQEWNQRWLEQLPKFKELSILSIGKFSPATPTIARGVIEKIADCRNLRIINLFCHEFHHLETVLHIAHNCPLLERLSIKPGLFTGSSERAEDLFSCLLRSLPLLEVLELGLNFRLSSTKLQDIAHYWPQLIVLNLPQARLCLSFSQMVNIRPLRYLKVIQLKNILFENPEQFLRSGETQSIVTQWRRIFPRLKEIPCPADIYSHYMEKDDPCNEAKGNGAGAISLEEMATDEPGLDFDDFESKWFIFRTKLWRALGYGKDLLMHDKILNMWQSNMEIEIIGWPVIPLEAFFDPDSHSTTIHSMR
ncbi:hypothetical protein QQS21_011905 [Conoideocrella luteorostrata]|uniref:Uncharacterized protein n=1 Tax=Conoideocrella luteorostrata TaxID=1105319 RepID=A0AAJ0CEJ1_9HYPO|nr:hypothetical protein QQS21_011905 [Conoideocrella luteorostrata]